MLCLKEPKPIPLVQKISYSSWRQKEGCRDISILGKLFRNSVKEEPAQKTRGQRQE